MKAMLFRALSIFLLGAGVVLTLGWGLPASVLVFDWLLWSSMTMMLGTLYVFLASVLFVALKGIYRYIIVLIGLLTVAAVVAIECFIIWQQYDLLLPMIPARALFSLVAFVLLWFMFNYNIDDIDPATEKAEKPKLQPKPQQPQTDVIERITLRTGTKIRVLTVDEIVYLRADGDYVEIIAADGRWLKEQTMKWFEEKLPRNNFLRIHRSCIVNLSHINRIERYGTQYHVQLHTGETLAVSASGYKLLREKLAL